MEAIVLAGGLGTRLRAAVPDWPKPLAPVNGRPFLEYVLRYWRGQGVHRVVLSVGYKHEIIAAHFKESYLGMEIAYAVESEPLGTGGGFLNAVGQIEGDVFLLLNGDTYFEMSLEQLLAVHEARHADLTFSLAEVAASSRYGAVEIDSRGQVQAFHASPRPASTGTMSINAGAYLISRHLVEEVRPKGPLSFESECLPRWLAQGRRLFGAVGSGLFVDIGIPEDYARAERLVGT